MQLLRLAQRLLPTRQPRVVRRVANQSHPRKKECTNGYEKSKKEIIIY
jgi:hypothetical protein